MVAVLEARESDLDRELAEEFCSELYSGSKYQIDDIEILYKTNEEIANNVNEFFLFKLYE
ncbi:hypothetical protein ACFFUC_12955 [Paracoccus cavernae]|uniref:hypothetical protein n=1 Tax=Paracoccus cavernae TaxID=1571207 RepID=UPI0035F2A602